MDSSILPSKSSSKYELESATFLVTLLIARIAIKLPFSNKPGNRWILSHFDKFSSPAAPAKAIPISWTICNIQKAMQVGWSRKRSICSLFLVCRFFRSTEFARVYHQGYANTPSSWIIELEDVFYCSSEDANFLFGSCKAAFQFKGHTQQTLQLKLIHGHSCPVHWSCSTFPVSNPVKVL